MDEDCDVSEDFGKLPDLLTWAPESEPGSAESVRDCPSLLCEEQENLKPRNDQPVDRNKEGEDEGEQLFNQANHRKQTGDNEQAGKSENNEEEPDQDEPEAVAGVEVEAGSAGGGDKGITNSESARMEHIETCEDKDEQKRGRKRRSKKQNEHSRCKKSCKVVEDKAMSENPAQELEKSPADPSLEPTVGLMDSSELADPMAGMWSIGMFCPPVPMALYSSQPPVPVQPAPPAPQATKRPHSPYLHSVPKTNPQPLEMEITQVYSTRRSVRYSTRDRGRFLSYPAMPGLENIDSCLLPPAPKKKTRTLYSTDQLEHLESLFQEDHYPDAEKRKAIAASVGVTPQRIMVWFQNRRAKWRKVERSISAKAEQKASRVGPHSSPLHTQVTPALPSLPLNNQPFFSGHFATKQSQIAPTVPTFPPLYSNLSTSPGHSRVSDGEPHQLSSQGGLAEYHPRPMHSPPPIRRASLPLFSTPYNPANPNPPVFNTLAHTPSLFLDALEASSSLPHHDTQLLQADTSSLFDYGEKMDYLSSAQQNTLLYQLQTSYPTSQPQPCVSYLNPSPYLTPNPPDSTSYLTFGPGAGSTGVVTYSTGGHAFFQSQSTGQVLLQSTGPHGGITAYPSYPWGNMYSQASLHQRPQCPPSYSSTLGAPRDLQLAPSGSAPPSVFFTRDQRSSHTQTHPSSTALPPVSTLRPPRFRAETTPIKAAPLLPAQVCPASPQSPPVPPCVKIEYDSPREIHSHFHCDFSPVNF